MGDKVIVPAAKVERNISGTERGRIESSGKSFRKTFVSVCRTVDRKDLWTPRIAFTTARTHSHTAIGIERFNGCNTRAHRYQRIASYCYSSARSALDERDFWFEHAEKFIDDPFAVGVFRRHDSLLHGETSGTVGSCSCSCGGAHCALK